jgi:hypothetical protein
MSLNIKNVIDAPYASPQTYRNLIDLLKRATADISFWGTRYIAVPSYLGTYSIDDLMERVDKLVTENREFNQEERSIGIELVNRINALDNESQQKLSSKWVWTRFFVSFLEKGLSFVRDVGEYYNSKYAEYYTRDQYKNCFGKDPETEPYLKASSPGIIMYRNCFGNLQAKKNYPETPSLWKAPKKPWTKDN